MLCDILVLISNWSKMSNYPLSKKVYWRDFSCTQVTYVFLCNLLTVILTTIK